MNYWVPEIGEVVCDCRYKHLKIVEIDGDDAILEDGAMSSIKACLDPIEEDHVHPEGY